MVIDLYGVPYRVGVFRLETSREATAAGLEVHRIIVVPPWDNRTRNIPSEDAPFYSKSMCVVSCISPEAVKALNLERSSSAARKYLLNKKIEGPAQWEDRLEYTVLSTELAGVAPGIAAFLKARAFAFCGGPVPERSVFQELIKAELISVPPRLRDPLEKSSTIPLSSSPKLLEGSAESSDAQKLFAASENEKYREIALRLSSRELAHYVHSDGSYDARKSLEEMESELENPPPDSVWARLSEEIKGKPIVDV